MVRTSWSSPSRLGCGCDRRRQQTAGAELERMVGDRSEPGAALPAAPVEQERRRQRAAPVAVETVDELHVVPTLDEGEGIGRQTRLGEHLGDLGAILLVVC